jgi:hypothetical protein
MPYRLFGFQNANATFELDKDHAEQNSDSGTGQNNLMQRVSARQLFDKHVVNRDAKDTCQDKQYAHIRVVLWGCDHAPALSR